MTDATRNDTRTAGAALSPPLVATVVLLVAVAVYQAWVGFNADNSWLISVALRMLDGERLYTDVVETNPPMSILLYVPAAFGERLLGIAAEHLTIAATLAGACLTLRFAGGLLQRGGIEAPSLWAGVAILAVLVLYPGQNFAQRDHIGAIAALPMLAAFVLRAEGLRPGRRDALIAGALAGFAMSIKPHFALAFLLPGLYAAARRRSLGPVLTAEVLAASAVVVAYGVLVVAAFPAFVDFLPVVLETYLAYGRPDIPLWNNAVNIAFALVVATTLVVGRGSLPTKGAVSLLAAFGFMIAATLQAKYWFYHFLPAFMLAFVAAIVVMDGKLTLDRRPASGGGEPSHRSVIARMSDGLLAAAVLFLAYMTSIQMLLPYPLPRALLPIVAPHATGGSILAVTEDIAVANPLSRWLGARNGATACSLWLANHVAHASVEPGVPAETLDYLSRYVDMDRQWLLDDMIRERPDVVLFDKQYKIDWQAWAMKDPRFAAEMAAYDYVGEAMDVAVWARRR